MGYWFVCGIVGTYKQHKRHTSTKNASYAAWHNDVTLLHNLLIHNEFRGGNNPLRIYKFLVLKMIKSIKERHEKSHIKKFPDPDGQESLFHVCSSALIVNLFVLFQLYLIGAITHIRPKSTKKFWYWRKYEKNLIENSSKVAGMGKSPRERHFAAV